VSPCKYVVARPADVQQVVEEAFAVCLVCHFVFAEAFAFYLLLFDC
jgi:hypothetical protein